MIENAYIQTMMIPVRYTDFDGHQENRGDHPDKGIIEDYIGPLISEKAVDMVITVSQSEPNSYNIDVFATATRGGFNDNCDFVRDDNKSSVKAPYDETIETTLPAAMSNDQILKEMIKEDAFLKTNNHKKAGILAKYSNSGVKSIYYGKYYEGQGDVHNENFVIAQKGNIPNTKIFDGPGGNYLSNEIFYRVAKVREDNFPTLPTGHFHIAKKQLSINDKIKANHKPPYSIDDLKNSEITEVVNEVKKTLAAGFKTL